MAPDEDLVGLDGAELGLADQPGVSLVVELARVEAATRGHSALGPVRSTRLGGDVDGPLLFWARTRFSGHQVTQPADGGGAAGVGAVPVRSDPGQT